jgi:DNA processing protein
VACDRCLVRGLLLRELAARLERAVDRGAGSRARDLLALGDAELRRALGAGSEVGALPGALAALGEELVAGDCWAVCRHDPEWPRALGRLGPAAPRALFARGRRELLGALADAPTVTLVGSRRAGPYGREVASGIAERLAGSGVGVISGMALGADTAAHRGALCSGVTIAVLGAGPERAYPRSNARLYREVCERGLVLSELPPRTPTFRWTFPARNRLMAALAEITVVVEAAERSGSLITAEMAADCGRIVGAVPGPVNSWRSAGTNALLADGACLIRDAGDVLEAILGPGAAPDARPGEGRALSEDEGTVLDAIEGGAGATDRIVSATGLPPGVVLAAISRLELAGLVRSDFSGACRRSASDRRR